MLPAGTSVWVLTDGKAGDEGPCLGVCDALGVAPAVKRVAPGRPWVWLGAAGPVPPADRPRRTGSPIAPPFPDILIASGRRAVPYVRAVKRASGGRTFTVVLKDPRTGTGSADFLWVPAHDRLRGDNVMVTLTGPHRVSAAALEEARARPRPGIAALPRPRVAVLLGGPSKDYVFADADIARLVAGLGAIAAGGATLMVTVSRRTPQALSDAVASVLAGGRHLLHAGGPDNPYRDFLALADAIVATADSTNMLGEAAATGAPILVFEPTGGSRKLRAFLDGLVRHGAARPFAGHLESFAYEPLDTTPAIAAEIARRHAAFRAGTTGTP